MAGGGLLPSSIYVGGAPGNLSPSFYVAGTNTVANQGAFEGIGVVASLGAIASAILQFNAPEVIPTGQLKLRTLAMANATSGTAYWQIQDGITSPGSSVGTTALTLEPNQSLTWTTADILMESKQNLSVAPSANQIITVILNFAQQSGSLQAFTLAQISVWQQSLIWE
jgi:hypothetical protein